MVIYRLITKKCKNNYLHNPRLYICCMYVIESHQSVVSNQSIPLESVYPTMQCTKTRFNMQKPYVFSRWHFTIIFIFAFFANNIYIFASLAATIVSCDIKVDRKEAEIILIIYIYIYIYIKSEYADIWISFFNCLSMKKYSITVFKKCIIHI